MKKTILTILVTSAVWIVLLLVLIPFFTTTPYKDPRYDMSAYQSSDHANWISVPENAKNIYAHFYGGFDTNYTLVTFDAYDISLESIIEKSLKKNVQYKGDSIKKSSGFTVTLDGFFRCFLYDSKAIPSWWVSFLPRGEGMETMIACWERNRYGMGYVGVYDGNRVSIFRFSQQHQSCDSLNGCFPSDYPQQ